MKEKSLEDYRLDLERLFKDHPTAKIRVAVIKDSRLQVTSITFDPASNTVLINCH